MLSSTFLDLVEHRQAVLDAMGRVQMQPVAMEHDAALPAHDRIDASLAKVDESDAYVCLIGYRYGAVPECPVRNPHGYSLTELEFRRALKRKLPICLFVMSDAHPIPRSELRADRGDDRLEAFTKFAGEERVWAEFTSPEDLRLKAVQSLTELRRLLERQDGGGAMDAGAGDRPKLGLPSPPAMCALPEFIPGCAFVGRTREVVALDSWCAGEGTVLLLEAVGGMGKSTLAWEWTKNHASRIRRDWAGIFWYSFYESGSDMGSFSVHALAYMLRLAPEQLSRYSQRDLRLMLLRHLQHRRWLVVLDGLERVLVAFNRFDAAQLPDDDAALVLNRLRPHDCIRSMDHFFLRALLACSPSKILITSRLAPAPLYYHGVLAGGVDRLQLTGLDPSDAELMLRGLQVRGDGSRMRTYLLRHFDCHPLVSRVVGGLVMNYRKAPGDFDRWADDPAGGAEPDLARMDLVQRRNHILRTSVGDLPDGSRAVLNTLSLVADAVDFTTLQELNPSLPPPPRAVEKPENLEQNKKLQELKAKVNKTSEPEAKGKLLTQIDQLLRAHNEAALSYERYCEERKQWAALRDDRQANETLTRALEDLETRGLVQWDRVRNLYDLHPVVRGYVASTQSSSDKDTAAARVVDHFSSRAQPTIAQAKTLSELRNPIQVVRALLHRGKVGEAKARLSGTLAQALLFNLEQYHELLSLAHPFFPDGLHLPPHALDVADRAQVANEVAIALERIGRAEEAADLGLVAIDAALAARQHEALLGYLRNQRARFRGTMRIALADRVLQLMAALTPVTGKADDQWLLLEAQASQALFLGRLEDAARYVDELRPLQRPKSRAMYRLGSFERLVCWLLFRQGQLTEAHLESAQKIAAEGNARFEMRDLLELRGLWQLSGGNHAGAERAFAECIELGREVSLDTAREEARLAIARAHQGQLELASAVAEQLHAAKPCPYLPLSVLYEILGNRQRALECARHAYEWAWADGRPYVHYWAVEEVSGVFGRLGEDLPNLPRFHEEAAMELPFEEAFRARMEELKPKQAGAAAGG